MPQPSACSEAFALDGKGFATYPDGPGVVVQWPACPRKWHVARRWAGGVYPLHKLCEYAVMRDVHKNPLLGAAGHRLLMEALRIKETPQALMEAKHHEETRKKAGK